MKSLLLTAVAVLLISSGCAKISVTDAVLASVNTRLLYSEFEAAAKTAQSLDLDEKDRKTLNTSIYELNLVRIELGRLPSASDAVLLITSADDYLNNIATNYEVGRDVVLRYYRTHKVPISTELIRYDRSAKSAYKTFKRQADARKGSLDSQKVINMLALAFRAYAAGGL